MVDKSEIIDEIDVDQLMTLLNYIDKERCKIIVLKFTATWCKPCQNIKQLCDNCFEALPKNSVVIELDVDNNLDMYMFMKRKRIVNGIPALLAWFPSQTREPGHWYIPDDSVSGSEPSSVSDFFKRCSNKANGISH